MKTLTRYGTYGFLSLLLAAQMEMVPDAGKAKAQLSKKSHRAVKNLKRSALPRAA